MSNIIRPHGVSASDLSWAVVEQSKEVEALRKDAERYRWLRAEHERHDPICHLVWKRNGARSGSEWVNTERLDVSIDAAKAAPEGGA